MHTTIIFAHPWHGSFNKAILDAVILELDKHQIEYRVIDLNKDGFNPVMLESELALYSKGQHADSLVQKYQSILKDTDELILIFPIWWYNIPAILKGFIDKVMLKGVGLRNIKWYNSELTTTGSRGKKEKYLAKITKLWNKW